MKIPFTVRYRIDHKTGQQQRGAMTIYAATNRDARVLAREVIRTRCGEPAAWVNAEPAVEVVR